jgi:Tol biopolymer transport system component
MTRRTDLLDRAADLFPAPDGALQQLRRRHHRRQRNRRLAAGGVGLAIVITMVTIALRVGPPDPPRQPVSTPTTTATIDHGRILFVILHDGKSTLATIDATGLRRVASFPDPTFFHPVWASRTEIVYDGRGTGERHLYRVSLDGGEPVQLLRGTASQVRPAISPDGSLVVYDQYDPETDEDLGLHIADASDGSGARPVFASFEPDSVGGDTSATFSPDGEWIAFSRTPDWGSGRAGIWVARTDGTDLRRLTGDELDAGYPRWSPDGDSILFSQNYNSGDLYARRRET